MQSNVREDEGHLGEARLLVCLRHRLVCARGGEDGRGTGDEDGGRRGKCVRAGYIKSTQTMTTRYRVLGKRR